MRAAVLRTMTVFGLSLGGAAIACAEGDGRRVLSRETEEAGPVGVGSEELGPLFDAGVTRSLKALESGDGGPAIDALGFWLSEHPNDPAALAANFALGYGLYVEGRIDDAMAPLTRCASSEHPLADHCTYWQAEIALKRGRFGQAATLASAVARESVFADRADWLRARATLEGGDAAGAVKQLEAFLAANPQATYRDDVEMMLGRAYEESGDLDDAARLYHRISVLHPGDTVEKSAERKLALLRPRVSEAVRREVGSQSLSEKVDRAGVLFGRHRSDQVIAMLDEVIPEMAKGSATACTAHFYAGQSQTKLRVHREAAPHYEAIAADCSDPVLVSKALYHLGKGMWTVDEDAKAIAAFEQVWTRFPASSLADDAMNYAAQVLDGQGKKAEAQAMFQRQLETYPKGDMVPDALWAMMFERYAARDYRGAVALADRVSGTSGEDDIYTRGRIAYFRARSLEEMRQPSDAKAAYTAVVRNHPMGFYTLLSLNRLAAMDREGTRSLVAELKRPNDKTEGFIEMVPEVAENRHFVAGVLLLRLSLFKLAAQEFGALRAEFPNRDEVGWLVAKLFDRSGNYQRSHAVPGPRLDMHLAYPAGSNVERWKIAFPQPYLEEVTKRARERGLDPAIIYAIMREESGFNAGIESFANAYGLLQLMLPTANDMAKKTGRGKVAPRDLFQPSVNIELGTMFMKVLSESYDGHAALIIGGYNGGRGNIDKWLKDRSRMPLDLWVEEIPFAQTREYVKRVTTSYWVYHWLYGSGEGWVDLPFDLAPPSPR